MIQFASVVGIVVATVVGVLVYRNATTRRLTRPIVWSLATGLVSGIGVAWVLQTHLIVRSIGRRLSMGNSAVAMRPVEMLLIQLVVALSISALVAGSYRLSTHGGSFTDQAG